jgi:hypothetical protein
VTVIADARFLTPDRILELEAAGATAKIDTTLTSLDMPEPAYGEEVIGTLTAAEAALFHDLYKANLDAEGRTKDIVGRKLEKLGSAVRSLGGGKGIIDLVNDEELANVDDDEQNSYHRLTQRAAMLHTALYFHVGERLNAHGWRLGIRSKGRVVRIERR